MNRNLKGAGLAALAFLATRAPVLAQTDYSYSYSFDASAWSAFGNALDTSAGAATGLFAAAMIVPIVVGCVFFVIEVAVAIWIYKDAVKHKVENPALWGILAFFLSWVGWLIYFLAIRNKTTITSTPVQK